MRFLGALLFLCAAAFAGEQAVFDNGSRLHVDRHEIEGSKARLYLEGGVMEIDAAKVVAYEKDEFPSQSPKLQAPALSAAPAPAAPTEPAEPAELADAAAEKYGLPRHLVRSVMAAESGFQQKAVSPKGAIGLMQLMPETAKELGANPHDPAQNVDAGARYLRDLLVKYDGRLWHALAAYNAGPAAVDKYDGIPPYSETINYVNRIDRAYRKAAE
jgi:soluble lytic murein transglycosylase-like protein